VWEQYNIDSLKPHYIVFSVAGSSLGFKHSEATKELFRKNHLGIKKAKSLGKKVYQPFLVIILDPTLFRCSISRESIAHGLYYPSMR
jgi:hypothetical protein